MTGSSDQLALIKALQQSDAYPHSVSSIDLIETHISWVILTGSFAYKIKKALRLDFLDFSTLERRHHFCLEELRLNQRWAPELYLEVVPVGGSHEKPSIGTDGNVVEYALKMVQFPQSAQLDNQVDAGLLRVVDVCALGETIAGYHNKAKVSEFVSEEDSIRKVSEPMLDNFRVVRPIQDSGLLSRLQDWTKESLRELERVFVRRRKGGFVRECHGDLHLANLVRLPERIVAFDCVEFSEELRTIDVISDVAFLVMDLVARARQDLAYALLNRYLECTGDYSGMTVFNLYFVYHSMIRAKVAAIRITENKGERDSENDIGDLKHNLAVAARSAERHRSKLIAMHGFSGSGKTWLSSQLMLQLPAIRVRSDIERKRLFGLREQASSDSRPGQGIYTTAANANVYERLLDTARYLLLAGFDVIVDASFLRRTDREMIESLAEELDVSLTIVDTRADEKELLRRMHDRQLGGKDASEADSNVVKYQAGKADTLNRDERKRTVFVRTDEHVDPDDVVKHIKRTAADSG